LGPNELAILPPFIGLFIIGPTKKFKIGTYV